VDRVSVPASLDLDYAFALADELEQVVPHPVDVRVINDAPLPFRYNVSRGIPLYIGCVSAFFPMAYSIPQSFVQVLGQAGVDYTTLGG
jgi:hypothetical protein